MKTLILLFLALELLAFDNVTAAKIFDKIFQAMMHKQKISVYTSNKTYKDVIITAPSLHLSKSCHDADIILMDSLSEIPKKCEKKLFFTTSYLIFQKFDNAVGAFYWDRGHISIKFSESRLEKYHINLPDSFDKYVVEKER